MLGKAGRAETSTDPAPLSMMETVIMLKPHDQWRKVDTWYSVDWAPEWLKGVFRRITPDRISTDQLVEEMNEALKLPGVSNAWTMPIKARIDMLTTGVRTPVGIKIYGADINADRADRHAHRGGCCRRSRARAACSPSAPAGGYFLDFKWNRDELARYGLSIDDAQMVIMSAVGGDTVTTTVEGRERYPVNVRYLRDYRSDPATLGRVLVPAMDGQTQVPLAQLAEIRVVSGPAMLRNENGMLNGYVYVDVAGRDIGSYVDEAKRVVREQVQLPPGYSLAWSGQYEAMQRVRERLAIVLPLTLFLILMLLYLNTKSMAKTAHHAPGGAVLRGGRHLAPVPARLQHEHRRVGGADRADGRGCGDRRVHAALSGPGLRRRRRRKAGCAACAICRRRSCTARSSASARSS